MLHNGYNLDTCIMRPEFIVSEVSMNRWLGLTFLVFLLLLVGSMVSGAFMVTHNSDDISQIEQFSEQSLPPGFSLVVLLSSLLFIAILLIWRFPDKTYVDIIRHFCSWYNSGYDGMNISVVQPLSPIT